METKRTTTPTTVLSKSCTTALTCTVYTLKSSRDPLISPCLGGAEKGRAQATTPPPGIDPKKKICLPLIFLHIRQSVMDSRGTRGEFWRDFPNYPEGICPPTNDPELTAKVAQDIEKLIDKASLQPELKETLAELRVLKARERQEEEDLKRYRVEHHEHLVVPSVKKLRIFGRWIMLDAVLETMLGRVFRIMKELKECLTEGYSLDTLVKPQAWGLDLPFSNDARTRVQYRFAGRQAYFLAPSDGSEAQPAEEEEENSVE
ncbi:hypothetical protein BG000_007238 [Podila horticola]|nr:hypothetical protein BG000_007238 [Podila horticola]